MPCSKVESRYKRRLDFSKLLFIHWRVVSVFVSCFEEKKKTIHTVLFYSIFPEHSFPRRIQHFRADSWMTFKVGSKSSYRLFRRKKKVKSPPKLKLSLKSENSQYVIAAYCELFKQLFTMLEPSFINLGNEVMSSLKHNKRFHFNVKASLKVT